jgi:hypothetical protein
MALRAFHKFAKQYSGYWFKAERHLFEGLASGDQRRRLEAIQKGAGYFRIARNFRKKFDIDRGLARLAPVLGILEQFRSSELTTDTLCETIALLRAQLGAGYGGGDRLSAATKLLWLLRRDPVVIYDSQARSALCGRAGDYAEYVERWRSGYAEHKNAIGEACAALSRPDSNTTTSSRETAQEWFRQRVYDIYLWRLGAPGR